jgi:aspartate aminotransferase
MASMLDSQVSISNWAAIPQAAPDKILGLNEEFVKCTDAGKISLGIGAYRDDDGKPMVLNAVREARKVLEGKNMDHEYTTIAGIPAFLKQTLTFAYGENAEIITSGRVAAVQSLSGQLIGRYVDLSSIHMNLY